MSDTSISTAPISAAPISAAVDPERAVLSVSGPDAEAFLQGLLTNDVRRAGPDRAVYAALLTPQGKFLYDLMLVRPAPERFLLDVDRAGRDALAKRLSMYKLRAKATIAPEDGLSVLLRWRDDGGAVIAETAAETADGPAAEAAFPDPRDERLGARALTASPQTPQDGAQGDLTAYERLRVRLGVPKSGLDLLAEDTFPLEAGFERVHGVDFRKGCYVGQEVTARMKHKATLKKRLARLEVQDGAPAPGAEVMAGDRPAGRLGSVIDGEALAVLRVDRLEAGPLTAGGARLMLIE